MKRPHLGFGADWIRTPISVVTDISHRVLMGKACAVAPRFLDIDFFFFRAGSCYLFSPHYWLFTDADNAKMVRFGSFSKLQVIKLFSRSTQLSMKFKMLINIEIAKIDGIIRFNSLEPFIYHANKC